jgi:hypothetical protein
MVSASGRNNLINDEAAKVADEPQEFIILVCIPCPLSLFLPLQETKFRSRIS